MFFGKKVKFVSQPIYSVKQSTVPKTHLFTLDDLHLFELSQIFTACSVWLENNMQDNIATFDLTIREMPNRNFLVFSGLEEILVALKNWKYSKKEIFYLKKFGLLTPKLESYLKRFKFSGDIFAMREGTIFFPGEPVIRVTAPLPEANLITMLLINVVCSNTLFTSKAVRCVIAAKSKACIGITGIRSHGFESSMKCYRASYIAGTIGTASIPGFAIKYNLAYKKALTNAYHALIKSFPSELEAMRCICTMFGGIVSLMVDTYDFEKGMQNAIIVGKELKKNGKNLHGIMIDSGDLLARAKKARKMLDAAGLKKTQIVVGGNLDEFKLLELNKKKIPANGFLVCTEAANVTDAPKLEVVYKLAEIIEGKKTRYTAKFSVGKQSYPGKKQVFRTFRHGRLSKDTIGLDSEKLGKKLLFPVIKKGKIVYGFPSLDKIKEFVKKQLNKQLPKKLLSINKQHYYRVEISGKIKKMFEELKKEHCS